MGLCIRKPLMLDKYTNTDATEGDNRIKFVDRDTSELRSARSRYVITINTDMIPTVINGYGNQCIELIGAKSLTPSPVVSPTGSLTHTPKKNMCLSKNTSPTNHHIRLTNAQH